MKIANIIDISARIKGGYFFNEPRCILAECKKRGELTLDTNTTISKTESYVSRVSSDK